MIRTIITLSFLLLFSSLLAQVPVEISSRKVTLNGVTFYEHTVQPGQTPYSISKAYVVTIEDLHRANPGMEYGLKAGSVILIPDKRQSTPAHDPFHDGFLRHKVQQSETIYGICKIYGITQDQLVNANPDLKNGLKIGDVLRIPQDKPFSPAVQVVPQRRDSIITHEVVRKETLYSLSRDYEVSIEEIQLLNPDLGEVLRKGELIRIPYRQGVGIKANAQASVTPEPIKPRSQKACEPLASQQQIRIALLLPLRLEETGSVDVSYLAPAKVNPADHKSLDYIQFYEGFRMAADSLKTRGLDLVLDVYDVPTDSLAFLEFLKDPELLKADLIIGPENSANIRSLSRFASENQIYLLNPWFNHEMYILGSPYTINLVPQVTTQLRFLCEYMLTSRPDANYIIVHDRSERNLWVVERLKEELGQALRMKGKPDTLYSVLNYSVAGIAGLQKLLIPGRENVIITVASNEAFISSYVARLNALSGDNQITLVGMPWWRNFDRIETHYLQNLNLHLFTRYYIDYEDAVVNRFVAEFRNQYKVEPDPQEFLPFRAYDIAMYFGTAMQLYGKDPANCFNNVPYKPMYTEFRFESEPGSGYENIFINLYKIEDFKLKNVVR
jgi:LysM repeat protein